MYRQLRKKGTLRQDKHRKAGNQTNSEMRVGTWKPYIATQRARRGQFLTEMSEALVNFSNREEPKRAGLPLSLAGSAAHCLSPGLAKKMPGIMRIQYGCKALVLNAL